MNKKLTLFLILISIGVLYILNVEKVIQNKLSLLNQSIQSSYINIFVTISNALEKYLHQLDYINQLKDSNETNLKYKTLYDIKVNEIQELTQNINQSKLYSTDLKLEKVQVLSYYKFNDNSRVIIDKKNLQNGKIYSLITFDGFSAGIVLNKNSRSVGYLNQNAKCNYTVFIGKENAPGITNGIDTEGNLVIKYVPIWKKILVGEEVVTSSMDGIFPFGIKVGKVLKIDIQDNIQEVIVKPYAKTLGNRDYFLYQTKQPQKTISK